MAKEAKARIKINKLLENAGWSFLDSDDEPANIELEAITNLNELGEDFEHTKNGFIDYLLLGENKYPICILEAKRESIHPLSGKEQARIYADSMGCQFVLLSNGISHYFWDIKQGDPQQISKFPTPSSLQDRLKYNQNSQDLAAEEITENYLAVRTLRDYQVQAIHAVQQAAKDGKKSFLLEMATGTGKTTIAAALCQLFLKTGNARRILFLVDRLELENQAEKNFREIFKDRYFIRKYKDGNWHEGLIIVSTVQSLLAGDKYRAKFSPSDFDLVISDEAHRSISGEFRAVFDYFTGYKLGLTATPKDYLKGVDSKTVPNEKLKELEIRNLLDTYKIFGCAGGEPTFRYDLNKGVREGVLIKPHVLDARTDITAKLLSEEGYAVMVPIENEEEIEAIYKKKDYERFFRNDNTNRAFCKTIIERGIKDPITGEFGKTLVFCVRCHHAAIITNMLNEYAREKLGYTDSKFAIQITSEIFNAQKYAKDFANNRLHGRSQWAKAHPDYDTSKTRVCITVGMMTTGYDCPDLLNIVLLRPIFSPSDFIQMKGRGTRKYTFRYQETGEKAEKTQFLLFDFFANYEYFEKNFKYDEKIPLPSLSEDGDKHPSDKPTPKPSVEDKTPDRMLSEAFIQIGDEGMKIDRNMSPYEQFENVIYNSQMIQQIHTEQGLEGVLKFVKIHVFNQPTEHWTAEKIRQSYAQHYKPDRKISLLEMLMMALQMISSFKTRAERIDEEFQKFRDIQKPDIPMEQNEEAALLNKFFETYLSDKDFREIIDSGEYGQLATYSAFNLEELNKIGRFLEETKEYIKEYLQSEIAEFNWKDVA